MSDKKDIRLSFNAFGALALLAMMGSLGVMVWVMVAVLALRGG